MKNKNCLFISWIAIGFFLINCLNMPVYAENEGIVLPKATVVKTETNNKPQNNISNIEKIFYNPDKTEYLKQFGYEIFNDKSVLTDSSKTSKDYKLNIGDRLDIYFWGDSIDMINLSGSELIKNSNDVQVDKEGNIFIKGVGIIPAKGRTVSSVEKSIMSGVSAKFDSIKVKVVVADSGKFPVIVTGNVKYPGTVFLNTRSTILDALNFAGGIQKNGSLREIIYINSKTKKRITVDLYALILNGNYSQITFGEGDLIFVKPVGKVVAVDAGVKNPGIYEFKNNETLKEVVNFSSGFLPNINPKLIQIEGFDLISGGKKVSDVKYSDLAQLKPKDGDFLQFKNFYDQPENFVNISGNIKNPGKFQYKKGLKLSDVLKSKDELLSGTFTEQAVIERVFGTSKEIVSIPVSLIDFFNGYTNPELMPQDQIKIFPSTTMETISVSGCILNPGIIPYNENMTLKNVLASVRFTVDSSNYENVSNTDKKIDEIQIKNIVAEITEKNNQNIINTAESVDNNTQIPASAVENAGNNQYNVSITENTVNNKETTKVVYLYDLLVQNDKTQNLILQAGNRILFRELKPTETLETVQILGHVNTPGIYKYSDNLKLKDIINMAGGVNNNGNLKGIIFLRKSVSDTQKQVLDDYILKQQENLSDKLTKFEISDQKQINVNVQSYINNQTNLIDMLKEKTQKGYGRISLNINTNDVNNLTEDENLDIQPGDEIFIPLLSKYIMVLGETMNQTAINYDKNKTVKDYINNVGGFTEHSRKNAIYIVKAGGMAERVKFASRKKLEPGDTVLVPRKEQPQIDWSQIFKDFVEVSARVLSSVYVITKI